MVTIKNQVRNGSLIGLVFLTALSLLTGCTPAGPRALLEGKRLLDEGKPEAALAPLQKATSLLPANALAWHYYGLAAHRAGRATDAERGYARALSIDRDLVEARFNLGCLLLEQNRPAEAKPQLAAYNFRRGNTVDGLLKLGTAQLRSGETLAAEKTFGEVLRLDARNSEALNGIGLARLQRGRPAEAAQFFNAAVRYSPVYGPGWLNLGIVKHQHLRDKPGALQAYKGYLGIRPVLANAAAVQRLVDELEQELQPPVTPQAVAQAQPEQNINPPTASTEASTPARVAAATPPQPATNAVSRNARAQDQSTASSQSASARQPTTAKPVPAAPNVQAQAPPSEKRAPAPEPSQPEQEAQVVKVPAETEIKLGQAPEPARAQRAPVSPSAESPLIDPPPERAPDQRGFLAKVNPLNLLDRGNAAPARQPQRIPPSTVATQARMTPDPALLKRYLYQRPPPPRRGNQAQAEILFGQGVAAQRNGKNAEAIGAYLRATQADPSHFAALYNLGLAYTSQTNFPAALLTYERALAARPGSVDARFNFAFTLDQAGYVQDAINELETILVSNPNEPRARLAMGNIYSQRLKQPAQAREHYLKVLEVEPRHAQASAIRQWLNRNPP